jgi:TonB-dependent receptor
MRASLFGRPRPHLKNSLRALARALGVAVCLASSAGEASAADEHGSIAGRVLDSTNSNPLPGAAVRVDGTNIQTSTDRTGTFRLTGVPTGERTLIVDYLGKAESKVTLTVSAGENPRQEIKLEPIKYKESVTVSADIIADAQARALNQQKTAANITNVVSADQIGSFPDANAAETTSRIPGLSIQRDQGEGRFVIVRGTEPRLNSMMIDGERMPAPDPLVRQAALDVIPSDLLQAIEVSKALTPDMDADAIGGSVNLVMKGAPEKPTLLLSAGGGYNPLLKSYDQYNMSGTGSRRTGDGRWGFVGSGSASKVTRGNQDMEVVYTPTLTISELNPRWYQVFRRRVGFTGAIDHKANDRSNYYLRGVFNRFIDDHENRQRVRWNVASRRIDRELRDRTHIERVASLTLGGSNSVGMSGLFDYKLSGSFADQKDPLTMTTTFRLTNVNYAPNVTSTSIDPNNVQVNAANDNVAGYAFNSQLRAVNSSEDKDFVAAANFRNQFGNAGHTTSFLKLGVKLRNKDKSRNRVENTYTTSSTLRITDFIETGFDLPPYLNGRYNLEPYISQSKVENIPNQFPTTVTRNFARDAEVFDGTETTLAGYAMAEIYVGSKLYILPGFRYEHTSADYTGRQVNFGPTGAYLSTTPISSSTKFGVPLPGVHMRYAIDAKTNLRAAVTRSLARPNYYELVPYRAQNDSDRTLALGNPNLNPTKAWNLDLMAEHYFTSVGVISGGVFYKSLDDYIFTFTRTETLNNAQYQFTQPLNGESATVKGLEVAIQNQLTFLPSPLNGLGFYANYTRTSSEAAIPARSGKNRLPGQSNNVGNVALSYEKGGFSGRLSMNFHGSYIDLVGATALLDRIYDQHKQLDLTLSQKLTKKIRLYANGINLNNAKLRYYQGVPERVLQEETYRWWAEFGVKVNF